MKVLVSLVASLCSLVPGVFAQQASVIKVESKATFPDPSQVVVNGVLGEAMVSSRKGRLATLPGWNDGELIKMFNKDIRDSHTKMDWYGEHGGKWLYTAAQVARQTHDKELEALLIKTADFLVSTQDADGYLGNYGPTVRITSTTVSHRRSWDTWNLSYMTLGLLEVNKYFPHPEYLNSAKRIGELFLKTFGDGKNDITDYGTRHGVSATVILDPVVELYKVTKDQRYLDFAGLIIKKMEATEGVKLISVALNGGDMENVGDGKIYQILWNLTALAKLYEVTGNADYLKAIQNAWQNVADYHLTIAGGPWGGIGKHLECFNRKNFWSPYGFIETCSIMSWIQLNKEMMHLTGDAKYAQEIEKATYNALLGARYPNGQDWGYHSFGNGTLHIAHFNDCCPSSGGLALGELPSIIYSAREKGVAVNLFADSEVTIPLDNKNTVHVIQKTQYPLDGKIQLSVSPSKGAEFPLFIRIPAWATGAVISINGKGIDNSAVKAGEYFVIRRTWGKKDVVDVGFPFELQVHQKSEQADVPQGGGVIYDVKWFALSRGPLVFATDGLIEGKDRERVLDISAKKPEEFFSPAKLPDGNKGPAFEWKAGDQQPLLFLPYFEAGGRNPGAWRLTWLQSKIE